MLEIFGLSVIELSINGEQKSVMVRPADTLLYVIREKLGLTGTKNSCGNGDCDSCTVLIDGWPAKACLTLAVEAVGHEITTIEGLRGVPMQQAFIDKFAIQCGYCTPGMILNGHALATIHPKATDEMIEEWLESNICRCTSYQEIFSAIKTVITQQ